MECCDVEMKFAMTQMTEVCRSEACTDTDEETTVNDPEECYAWTWSMAGKETDWNSGTKIKGAVAARETAKGFTSRITGCDREDETKQNTGVETDGCDIASGAQVRNDRCGVERSEMVIDSGNNRKQKNIEKNSVQSLRRLQESIDQFAPEEKRQRLSFSKEHLKNTVSLCNIPKLPGNGNV